MNYQHALILYRTVTPLHVGCGQAVGVVDLPVIRERATGYPYIPGSGIRGSLRDIFESRAEMEANEDKKKDFNQLTLSLFGPEPGSSDEKDKYAGCVAIHDARLLFYPVRADQGVFVWITCPLALQRFNRDNNAFQLGFADCKTKGLEKIADDKFLGPETFTGSLHLEEFRFSSTTDAATGVQNLAEFAEKIGGTELASRAVLVSNRSFYHFVNYATMLMQHNTLTSAKTVKDGALFSIESLPPETILYGIIGATRERRDPKNGMAATAALTSVKTFLLENKPDAKNAYLHLGGKESTGLGLTQLTWATNGLTK